MKIYKSRATKWSAVLAIVGVTVLISGIICILAHSSNIGLQIVLIMLGGLMSFIFLTGFFSEKSRYLTINDEKIVLPRGADINGKTSFNRTIINTNKICSIKSELHKGDGIVAKDTLFHTLTLNDGTRIKFTLYAYGKDAEDEILSAIKKLI